MKKFLHEKLNFIYYLTIVHIFTNIVLVKSKVRHT